MAKAHRAWKSSRAARNEVRPDFFREPPVKYTGGDLPWQWEEDGLISHAHRRLGGARLP